MKRTVAVITIAVAVAATTFSQGFDGRAGAPAPVAGRGNDHDATLAALPVESLSSAEREALLYMVEEEKMARDVYLHLYEVWNVRTFSNIARSEEQHIAAVSSLLDRYDIEAPATLDDPGTFENEQLQSMYEQLVANGEKSLEAAFTVGATIEDVDLADLTAELAGVDNQDIMMVFESLIAGSENHMRSFVRQLDRIGASYAPQHIDEFYYRDIVAGAQGGPQRAARAGAPMTGGRGIGPRRD